MSGKRLVSAITIFLNGEDFLEEAIESVLAQTFEDWELLLVDDGSTDNSAGIAQHYVERYPGKIRYLAHERHQNRGMSASRNLGIRHANGKYVTYLDADDIWLPRKLEEQTAILEDHPEVAMVYGPLKLWYSWSGKQEDEDKDFLQPLAFPPDTVIYPPKLLPKFLRNERYIPSSIMIRREVLEQIGGYNESFRHNYEDVVVHSKVCLEFPVYASGTCWYLYRQHEKSCDAVLHKEGQYHATREVFLNWLKGYLLSKGIKSGEVWRALQFQFWRYRHEGIYNFFANAPEYPYRIKVFLKKTLRPIVPVHTFRSILSRWRTFVAEL